jgi:hypothetical protein
VNAFRDGVAKLLPAKPTALVSQTETDSVAKLFEEIKVMFRDLPGRLQGQIHESLGPRVRRRRRMSPMMLMDMIHHSGEHFDDPALGWLIVLGNFKDDAPWLYEIGLEVYQALKKGEHRRAAVAIDHFEQVLSKARRGPFAEMIMDSPEMEMAVHELGRVAGHLLASASRSSLVRVPLKERSKPESGETGT